MERPLREATPGARLPQKGIGSMTNYTHETESAESERAILLNRRDLERIENEIELELASLTPVASLEDRRVALGSVPALEDMEARLGTPPTVESLRRAGFYENGTLLAILDFISAAGRVITLIVAELIQALAAIIIAIVFAMLEYQRVFNGASALGQIADQASLIAFAVVTANVVHPIYALRELRGQKEVIVVQHTLRGYLGGFWRRLIGKPTGKTVGFEHNPVLQIAATVITWSTIILAVYDILGPLVADVAAGTLKDTWPIALMKLAMGFGLSLAGVFFVQAASHEIGVRILTDQPQRLSDVLESQLAQRAASAAEITRQWEALRAERATQEKAIRQQWEQDQAARDQKIADVRQRVRSHYEAAKIASQGRKAGAAPGNDASPLSEGQALPVSSAGYRNGNGTGDH
jgi:hypothetical protein